MSIAKKLLFVILMLGVVNVYSQFTLDAELRPRFELRHGYKTLYPNNVDPAAFVSQRTRLNFEYKTQKLHLYLSPQDVRVWGDVPQLNVADNNGFSLHQAWAEILLVKDFNFKIGRQEIVYDDQRFFGNVGWAQQGRSHDAAILKYEPSYFKLHFGAAYNQDNESLTGNFLTVNTYKSLQYIWVNKNWEQLSASFMFLNNGLQYIDEIDAANNDTRYSQTVGMHLKTRIDNFNFSSNLYYQFGKDVADNDLSAYLFSLEANYAATSNLNLGLGSELQSGNTYGAPANGENKAFTPLYGTNHKFNGLMDYYYVGNHINNVGLLDIYGNVKYILNTTTNFSLALHQFYAAADINNYDSNNLGFELDLLTSYKLNEFVGLNLGYSQYFATKGIEIVKNNFDGNSNYWAWAMVTINPTLFTYNKNETTKL
ncbi:alginate export family protein [Aequorivita xiaoshiensis]|uniref:Alginate export family protein n=1 Tax=Aequorivita xiaoshiensis TaxID=2874476 RepID=A0A9X1R3D4_9FLAO|nr:alginate export family protein [Aequorivita xiaoshiensis]MCG2431531.1 alginate export family protein [Aequorivita xiaoshiensis]